MKSVSGITISTFFWIVLTVPGLLLLGGYQVRSIENRQLATWPEIEASQFLDDKMYSAISNWLDDHIPFRNIALNMRSIFIRSKIISSKKVIVGDNGWLYLRDSILHTHISDEELEKFTEQLVRIGSLLKRHGKLLYLIIAPDKASIYPEHVPYLYKESNLSLMRETDKLRTMLGAAKNLQYIDLWPSLIQNKKRSSSPLYYKTDTHWTCKGGLPLAKKILNAISPGIYKHQEILVQNTSAILDLNRMIGSQVETEFIVCKTVKNLPAPSSIQRSKNQMEGIQFIQEESGEPLIKEKTLVLYDSFLGPFDKILPAYFANLRIFHSNEARNFEALTTEMASSEYIIVELVERSFINWNRFILANEDFYPLLDKKLTLTGSK